MNTFGKMLTGLSLVVAGCAPPAYQAKQDYGLGHDSGVALYNIQQTLADSCKGGSFANEQGFSCTLTECTKYTTTHTIGGPTYSSCANEATKTTSLNWTDLDMIERTAHCINLHTASGWQNICTNNTQQAKDFEFAVRALRREMGAPLP